ncbi:Filamin-A [Eumeta japonica]|uniref:Filamin-A n=1 Tax=Eumeta variegata TaxID=151549 RepID=A0A4C1TCJ7_EUMVA|nr:Filamin-A [Eumeta japonica]
MAFMSGLWNTLMGVHEKDTTWQEISQYYFDNYKKYFSVSEFDKEEKPIVYSDVHKIRFNRTGLGLEFTPINFLTVYQINTRKAEVKMPSGHVDQPVIDDNRDGTVSIKYEPREEGVHELYVKYNGEHVQGSPYKFHVDSIPSGYVTAYGPGLLNGVSGEPSHFTISTKGAGAGGLSMAVEGPSKAEITCHDNKDGTVAVSYLPTAPGEYKISVRFGDKHIKGSPFVAKVTGEGRKRNQISVGSCSEVTLPGKITDSDIRSLNASIQVDMIVKGVHHEKGDVLNWLCITLWELGQTEVGPSSQLQVGTGAPSGLEEPCFLKMLPSGNIGISFTPREAGQHTVSVKKMGNHIQNSPFNITVQSQEVGDAKKVKVAGTALKEGKTHTENTFTVDTKNAGYGGLSLSIEGPSKAEIQCADSKDGVLAISYKPSEPGYYIINLKFADHHVEGSPFTVKKNVESLCFPQITGEGSNRQREKIQRQREQVPLTEVGTNCKLTFKMPVCGSQKWYANAADQFCKLETIQPILFDVKIALTQEGSPPFALGIRITSFDLAATVTSPGGVSEDAEIQEVEDGLYAVHFVPKELGVHTVSVKYREIHIPGSPFQFTVGPLRDSGAHLVKAGGSGLERGEAGRINEFNVWTREAGAGQLAISLEGPSKAEIDFKDRRDGSCDVAYKVDEPGIPTESNVFRIADAHISKSNFSLPSPPFLVAGTPTHSARCDTPAAAAGRSGGPASLCAAAARRRGGQLDRPPKRQGARNARPTGNSSRSPAYCIPARQKAQRRRPTKKRGLFAADAKRRHRS